MKKVLVVAAAAVVALMFGVRAGFAQDMKIGFVDFEKAFNEYNKTKTEEAKLKVDMEAKEKELEKQAMAVSKMRDELELLSDDAKKKKEQEIRSKVKDLAAARKDARKELLEERNKMWLAIYDEIKTKTAQYGKEKGYTFIFDDKAVIYKSEGYDVTNEIISLINSGGK